MTTQYENDKASSEAEATNPIKSIIARRKELSDNVLNLNEVMKAYHKEARYIDCVQLPEAMQEFGLDSFETDEGITVKIKEFVKASIPSETAINKARSEDQRQELIARREDAFEALSQMGAASLIKSKVEVDIPRGDKREAEVLTAMLKESGYETTSKESVHAGQLSAWAKEQLEQGTDLDFDVFGIYQGTEAELKLGRRKI
tara:strand:+ start:2610 stop:3215 length:606 start_codon:yes stop_codon:yes gene_type:complete